MHYRTSRLEKWDCFTVQRQASTLKTTGSTPGGDPVVPALVNGGCVRPDDGGVVLRQHPATLQEVGPGVGLSVPPGDGVENHLSHEEEPGAIHD